jgi:phosphoenolpyruvate carboxykinase (ATP)
MVDGFLDLVKGLEGRSNVTTLDMKELEMAAAPYGHKTNSGSMGFFSNVRNRSATISVTFGSDRVQDKRRSEVQQHIADNLDPTLETLTEYLKNTPLICVKRTIGDNSAFNPKCTLFLSTRRKDNVRQAYLWANTLRNYMAAANGPELYLICIPEWEERQRQVLCWPETGLNIVLGLDYVGEVKMGFLRMAMWDAKEEGMLSLHAGTKVLKARQPDGQTKRFGMFFFGLSGTGKSTHSCHDHGLNEGGEGIEILQDDITFLGKDGSALGTEKGFYLKTEGITEAYQPIIYNALTSDQAIFENVMVNVDGNIDFADLSLGSNGRAVIPRSTMKPHINETIDLPSLDNLDGIIMAFITRRMTVLPPVSKLSPEQAAAAFMLGESIETSAGDPRRAGQSVRVVGTNPFLIGDPSLEGNWFYDFVKNNRDKVHCYLLNTGGVGEIREADSDGRSVVTQKVLRIQIPEMAAIIRGIAKNTIQWKQDPYFGVLVPETVQGMDISKYDLDKFYTPDQAQGLAKVLKEERKSWLAQFSGLPQEVLNAVSSGS